MPKIVDHAQCRENIIKIVAEMLATVGVENTTIREISRQSGYSRGFIEHYFQNKDEMVSGAVDWINLQTMQRAQARLKDLQGLSALRELIEVTLPISKRAKKDWTVRMQFWGLATVNPHYKKEQSSRMVIVEKLCLKYLREAQALAEIPRQVDLEPLAQSLLHQAYGLSCNAMLRPGYYNAKRQRQALDRIFDTLGRTN